MISEISVRPKPRNNKAKIAFLIAILISALGFVTYFLMERYRGIVGMFALMMLVTAILFYTKYISPVFSYDITFDSEGTPIFVVRQTIGKRITTLCRIDLADISAVEYENAEKRRAHKTPKDFKKYVYAPTMFPPDVYRLTVSGRYEKAELLIECSEEFSELLKKSSVEARELRLSENDE